MMAKHTRDRGSAKATDKDLDKAVAKLIDAIMKAQKEKPKK